ncbi:MAG: hypothetical protein OXI35_07880 [Gemmatimonadota bacterium]|nr:hypothetical protein [Gemmatimonadota bacterium]
MSSPFGEISDPENAEFIARSHRLEDFRAGKTESHPTPSMSTWTEIERHNLGKVWQHRFSPMCAAWWKVISPEQRTTGFGQKDKPVSEAELSAYDQNPSSTGVDHTPKVDSADNILLTLTAVLAKRQEPAATGQQKQHLKSAVSQQEIDNWAPMRGQEPRASESIQGVRVVDNFRRAH